MSRFAGTVLVLGNFRPGLTVVRTLAAHGHRTIIGMWGGEGFVESSRAAHEAWHHPPLQGDGAEFVAALNELLAARSDIAVIYPVAEVFVACLSAHRPKLPRGVLLVSPEPGVVSHCADKVAMLELATQHGVPCEPFEVVHDHAAMLRAAHDTGYPTVVRPLTPMLPLGRKKALICASQTALRAALPSWPDRHEALLVQRRAHGERHNVFFAAWRGAIVNSLETRILRTDHLDGTGYAVDGVTVEPTGALSDACANLAQALNYTGIGLAQFIIDPATGRRCFLELNPRIAGSQVITEFMGQELVGLALRLARGEAPTRHDFAFTYAPGVRYAWTYGDLRGLTDAVRTGEAIPRQALAWLADAVRTLLVADVHMTWSWRDPVPTALLFLERVPWLRPPLAWLRARASMRSA